MRLCIVQSNDVNFNPVAEACVPSVKKYAELHGYAHIHHVGRASSREQSWDKLFLALQLFPLYEYVWSLDVDVIIKEPSIKVEDFLDPSADFNICKSWPDCPDYDVNAGSIIWRSCTWAEIFLKDTLARTALEPTGNWEQDVIQDKLKEGVRGSLVTKHPQDTFNHDGPFLKHFCGPRTLEDKMAAINEWKEANTVPAFNL